MDLNVFFSSSFFVFPGSLVVRLIFLPFEESSYATFAKLASGLFPYSPLVNWTVNCSGPEACSSFNFILWVWFLIIYSWSMTLLSISSSKFQFVSNPEIWSEFFPWNFNLAKSNDNRCASMFRVLIKD